MTDIQRQEDVLQVKEILSSHGIPEGDYNDYQIGVLARGYTYSLFTEADFDRTDYFSWLADPSVGTMEQKYATIIKAVLDGRMDAIIAEQGWGLMFVGAGRTDPAFVYTVGLTAKTGYEFIMVNPPTSNVEDLMNTICEGVIEGSITPQTVFTTDGYTIGQQLARFKLVELQMDSATASMVLDRRGEVVQIYQVWMGDKNNILPDEPGYDTTFVQTLSQQYIKATGYTGNQGGEPFKTA